MFPLHRRSIAPEEGCAGNKRQGRSEWGVFIETRDTTTENDHPEGLQPKYQYIWSARYIDAPILRDENTDNNGLCDDERIYYLSDANMNVTCLVDTAGDAIERYLYNPYGKVTIYTGDWSSTRSSSSYSNPILYTGRELDVETGLMHYRNRYYSTGLGRFVSRDPIGYHDQMSLYRYVDNRPLTKRDSMGLFATPPSGTVLKNCIEGTFTLVEEWVGTGLAAGISVDLVGRKCDCCGASGKVKDGWLEAGGQGTITVGGGFGSETTIF